MDVVGNSLWYLIAQSDSLSVTILLLLLCISILSWTVAIFKISMLWSKNRQIISFYNVIDEKKFNFEELIKYLTQQKETVGGIFVTQQLALFSSIFNHDIKRTEQHDALLIEMIDNGLCQSIDDSIANENRVLSLFATIDGIAPLLGLLVT